MIQVSGDVLRVEQSMTLDNARAMLESGNAAIAKGVRTLDLSAVATLDSSALAVVFGWQRSAAAAGVSLSVGAVTDDFVSLARLYGVADLLHCAASKG